MEHSDKEVLIKLEHVSMDYRLPTEKVDSLKEFVIRLIKRKLKYKIFTALEDVSLNIYRGESVAIVGRTAREKALC